ncbi:unnamed protein product [Linum tenue]|uniref:Uncharacterized protein n=1 Tax=Linum tenue TaxID=586396 RepID=A0AAV0H3E8_9ROSI|nr:unnamed protein product [Linum tenue]
MFLVGDGFHPQAKEIFSFVKEMMLPMIKECNDDAPTTIPELAYQDDIPLRA